MAHAVRTATRKANAFHLLNRVAFNEKTLYNPAAMIKFIKRLLGIKNKEKKDKPKIKWSLYGRVWKEIGLPYWKWLLAGIAFTVLAASAEGWTIMLVREVIDEGFISKNMNLLYIIGLQIVGAFLLKGGAGYAKSMIMEYTGWSISNALQERIFRHTIRTNIADFHREGIGKFMNYFGVQASAVLQLVTSQIISLVQDIATLVITLGLMIWFAPQMVVVLLFLIPAIFIPLIIITHQRNKLTRELFGIMNVSGQNLNQALHGIKTIQAFGMEDFESKKFVSIIEKTRRNSWKTQRISNLRGPIMETAISIGLCLSLLMAGHFITSGSISMGDFTAFLLALTAAYKPAKSINGINDGIMRGLIAADILFDFLDIKPTIRNAKNAVELSGKEMDVTFENVSFAYNEADGDVLHGINLKVAAGKTCAFVGPSGGGKTTMFNLMDRFYDPNKGRVLINGKDIKRYTLESLRRNISEVSQDVFLFNDSILENIKYGTAGATEEQVIEAAKIANAHNFIMNLPKKYATSVGERGTLLSGGQKQRIAIARAVLKNAPLLLLDEATSALDTESEKLIQAALTKLMAGKTVFVIAHRLSTILDADEIHVIVGGRIVESGTDAELTTKNGEYKKLRDIQFKDVRDNVDG